MTTVTFRVTPDPHRHHFHVVADWPATDSEVLELSLPAWIPGSYKIRDFAQHLSPPRAEIDGVEPPIEPLDKQTWRCRTGGRAVRLRYAVYALDGSLRAAYLDPLQGFFNGTSLFLRGHGLEDRPHELVLEPPSDPRFAAWQAVTAMPPGETTDQGFGSYRDEDYHAFIDHPVGLGPATVVELPVDAVPHRLAILGTHAADLPTLTQDLARLVTAEAAVFSGFPMARYLFLVLAGGREAGGGLEHRDSCALGCDRIALQPGSGPKPTRAYRNFLRLCAHEYWHAWNVKRIRPAGFNPPDLRGEVYTTLLWLFEGFTSYYEDLIPVRAGCLDAETYRIGLGELITRVHRGMGVHRQSLIESSFYAWTQLYQGDANRPNHGISYYSQGALLALCLDLLLREAGEARGLDAVMTELWTHYGQTGQGVQPASVPELVRQRVGDRLAERLVAWLERPGPLPLAEALETVGLELAWRPLSDASDRGGTPPDPNHVPLPHLGARWQDGPNGAHLSTVFEDEPAQRAGLVLGDCLVAVAGRRVGGGDRLEARLAEWPPGTTVPVHAFRGDRLVEVAVTLEEPPALAAYLVDQEGVSDTTAARYRAWLDLDR